MSGRPIVNEIDHPMDSWPLYWLNYFQDAEAYFDKLEETLEVVKRENAHFVQGNIELKELLDKLRGNLRP